MKKLIPIIFVMFLFSGCSEENLEQDISYTGEQLRFINCPLGGIGTGNILIGGYGNIAEIEVFNRPSMDEAPPNMTFFAIYTKEAEKDPVVRVLEREFLSEFPNPFGRPRQQLGGLPRFKEAVFHNAYPVVGIDLLDEEVPLNVKMHAWSPFIPIDTENSGIPAAVVEWELSNQGKEKTEYSIAFAMGNPMKEIERGKKKGKDAPQITPFEGKKWSGVTFSTAASDSMQPDAGQFQVSLPASATISSPLYTGGWWDNAHLFWDDFSTDGKLTHRADTLINSDKNSAAAMCISESLEPGESVRIPFIFSWYIPYRKLEASQAFGNKNVEEAVVKNYYATRYSGIDDVSTYMAENMEALWNKTHTFSRIMTESTVAPEILDAAISNLASLKTNLIMQDEDANVHAFEGLGNNFGCCAGNCTHVWNYAQSMAAIFPSLERNVRESGFGISTHDNGYQCFRTVFPISENYFKNVAADGQMGNIMRVYREWKMSGSDEWLAQIWPKVQLALEFAWKGSGELKRGFEWMGNCPVPWDVYKEGVLRGDQHNTYDINFFGPNMMTGSLYLGALKACSEMAMAMNEPQKAIEYKELYKKGRERYTELLWNDEYYIQKVEVIEGVNIPERLKSPPDEEGKVLPKYQYAEGCLSDQLLGQYLAFVSGLGYIMDTANTKTTLKSIYKYNFREHMRDFENVQRIYAANEEPGLVICTWPKGDKPVLPFVYSDEVWTGVEYQVATSMIFSGLRKEGTEIVSAVRSRYDGSNRNPFAEIESGRYYARALASWGVYQAMSGYQYDGVKRVMKFAPAEDVLPQRYFWSTAEAWGSINLSRAGIILKCMHGKLMLEDLLLEGKSFFVFREHIPTHVSQVSYAENMLHIAFPDKLSLQEGEEYRLDLP